MRDTWSAREEIAPLLDEVGHDPRPPSRGLRVIAVVAALAVGALAIPRMIGSDPEPTADAPPSESLENPQPPVEQLPVVRTAPGTPMLAAPEDIRSIELLAASRLALFRGSLDGRYSFTSITGDTPYATDEVTLQPYDDGVVIGPSPGASTPGPVRAFATPMQVPPEPVAGIVQGLDGSGYWIMDTERSAAGACVLHLVTVDGLLADTSRVEHPCEFVPERETAAGFVGRVGSRLDPTSGRLLDPRTGTLTPIGGALFASADRHVVSWTRTLGDPLVVQNVLTDERVEVSLPPGRVTRQVALSADGRYLAVVIVELLLTVRAYEVTVHDLVDGGARVAAVTTLGSRPLDLAWQGDVLIVLGNGIDAYDAATGELYRSDTELMPSRLDVVAVADPVGDQRT